MNGGLAEFDEMPAEEQAAALLKALEENPAAVTAMLQQRLAKPGVMRPESSRWTHGSGWDVNPERRRGHPV
ncbi:hypothetical protein [Saccharothrix obliqua]|uniref:hypothetical protein n=1 Tax=Saccharothrix obliqua TaxID=2861747 RepID=UPI001C5EFA15|nr:hypothetical protein [Saccharothrix obliqua]MBW4722392.1 hypothetical protein [Saccharothrix obliqua]